MKTSNEVAALIRLTALSTWMRIGMTLVSQQRVGLLRSFCLAAVYIHVAMSFRELLDVCYEAFTLNAVTRGAVRRRALSCSRMFLFYTAPCCSRNDATCRTVLRRAARRAIRCQIRRECRLIIPPPYGKRCCDLPICLSLCLSVRLSYAPAHQWFWGCGYYVQNTNRKQHAGSRTH